MEFTQNTVPDGGWGWMVVAAAALINMFNQSILSVFGLLFGEHLKGMNEETSGAALVTNLNCLAYNFSGFIIGPVIKAFTPRSVSVFGCLLTSSGFIICSLSTNLWHVILGYGFLVGIGLGLLATSTFVIILRYYNKRKVHTVCIAIAGLGISKLLMPQIIKELIFNVGYKIAGSGFIYIYFLYNSKIYKVNK